MGMSDHRKPPKPKHYLTAPKGYCRVCGKAIIKNDKINTRANWHPACVKEYKLVHFPRETRKAVWARDKGRCYICGGVVGKKEWELEHIKPLYEAKGRISYWELPNCGTACKPCHKKKTAAEAGLRAEARKADKPRKT